MDIPAVDCYNKANAEHPDCNCEPTLLRHPSHGCKSGDEQNARRKADAIIRSSGYGAFLDYMCPAHMRRGNFPPVGSDPTQCPRAILGVYDDHDFSWNDGNGYQLAQKAQLKQVFLDAIGEAMDSPRRQGGRGIYEHRVLNRGARGEEIDLILLDERYYRVPLPCHTRADFCDASVDKSASRKVWCENFLGQGNVTQPPSCCRKDEEVLMGWCKKAASRKDEQYNSACNPWHADFGTVNWVVAKDGSLQQADPTRWQDVQDESSFCEMLGKKQRQWLNATLEAVAAPVVLLGSGSVVMGHPEKTNAASDRPPHTGYCSGDDWDCYRPAQQNLLAMLARTMNRIPGCVIIMTGDYHFADIKRILPKEQAKYSQFYTPQSDLHLDRPIWQIMASGMDPSTADGLDTSCGSACCSFEKDNAGLRGPGAACHVYGDPNFGTIDFDWHRQIITLGIVAGDTGNVAIAADGAPLQVNISMSTCEQVV